MKKTNVKKCAKINRLTNEAIQNEIARLEMKTERRKGPGGDQTGSRYYAALVAERNARLGTPASS